MIQTISETELQGAVVGLAKTLGWFVHHDRPSMTQKGWRTAILGDAGFPDLVLVRRGVTLFWELKTARGKLTDPQTAWALVLGSTMREEVDWSLMAAGEGIYAVVRPKQWLDRRVQIALTTR